MIEEEVGVRKREWEGVNQGGLRCAFIKTVHVIERACGCHPEHHTTLPYLPEPLQGKSEWLTPLEAFSPGDMLIID